MRWFTIFLSFLLLFTNHSPVTAKVKDFEQSRYVDDEVWEAVKPYLLPKDHPIRSKLDHIFSKTRATAHEIALEKAGFSYLEVQGLHVVALRHSSLKGYVIKVILDHDTEQCDWEHFLERIEGANLIRQKVLDTGFEWLFKVPYKWIYPLPAKPSPPEGPEYDRKNFILIAEDMQVLKQKKNYKKYRKIKDKIILDALFTIVHDLGLKECTHVDNIPWCKDGKIAFVDTHYFDEPVNYPPLLEFLSSSMKKHWKKLIKNGGPKQKD